MSKRAENRAAAHARLTEVARIAFARDGYEKVTFRSLANEAGCSTGAFFSLWDSKEALYRDAVGLPTPGQLHARAQDILDFLYSVYTLRPDVQLGIDAMNLRDELMGRDPIA